MREGVVILIPVLRRPRNVAPLVASIRAATPELHRILFIADHGDQDERKAIRDAGLVPLLVTGTYAQKMNAGIRATDEPLIFLGADDVTFQPGWLEACSRLVSSTIGVVGTNDLGNARVMAGDHSTHTLLSRAYCARGSIDDPSVVLHEGYRHAFCDDELIATARRRAAWAFARKSVVEHHHPDWGKGERDAIYDLGRESFRRDRQLFRRRRVLWQ